ncbi:MAG: SDR family NAD(P)-dependent oxidoreductase [Leptospirales bacterium]
MFSRKESTNINNIFITGASSGLGRAMALEWALPGNRIGLVARRNSELQLLAGEIRDKGAIPFYYAGDVRDSSFMEKAASSHLAKAGVPDILIANAGIRGTNGLQSGQNDAEVMDINYHGARNTILPFLSGLINRKSGHILVISSLASFLSLPGAGGYCASKSALNAWCGSLRFDLIPYGIALTIVNPGFIRTEMTRTNPYPMPFIISAQKAAEIIRKRSISKPPTLNFPRSMAIALRILSLLPTQIRERFFLSMKVQK